MQKASLVHEFSVLKNPQVLMVLGISVLASASLFSTFTYITPILEDVTGFTPHAVTLVLLLFGLGLTVGSTLGGKLADWRLMPSLVAFLLAIVVILTIFAGTMHSEIPAMITIFVWGILAFAIVPPLQMLIVDRASHAPNLASTLEPGRVQSRQCDRRVARRHGDRRGRAAHDAAVGRRGDFDRRAGADAVVGVDRPACAAHGGGGLTALLLALGAHSAAQVRMTRAP